MLGSCVSSAFSAGCATLLHTYRHMCIVLGRLLISQREGCRHLALACALIASALLLQTGVGCGAGEQGAVRRLCDACTSKTTGHASGHKYAMHVASRRFHCVVAASLDSKPLHRAASLREDGVCQEVDSLHLD